MNLQEKMESIARDACIPTIQLAHLTMEFNARIRAEDMKDFYGVDKDPVRAFEKAEEKLSVYRNSSSYSPGVF